MAKQAQGEALAQEAELMRKLGLQLAELKDMGLAELRAKHLELFGEEALSKNLPFLRRRLAFRLQERLHGGLPFEAQAKVAELAPTELPKPQEVPNTRQRPSNAPGEKPPSAEAPRDSRLPGAGSLLRREHKGVVHEVEVLKAGFRYRGRDYRSLSAVAKEITGTAWNGFGFFGLMKGASHGQA